MHYDLNPRVRWPGNLRVLIRLDGLPLFFGDTLITPYTVCWWYPLNWMSFLCAFAWAVLRHPVKFIRHMIAGVRGNNESTS